MTTWRPPDQLYIQMIIVRINEIYLTKQPSAYFTEMIELLTFIYLELRRRF